MPSLEKGEERERLAPAATSLREGCVHSMFYRSMIADCHLHVNTNHGRRSYTDAGPVNQARGNKVTPSYQFMHAAAPAGAALRLAPSSFGVGCGHLYPSSLKLLYARGCSFSVRICPAAAALCRPVVAVWGRFWMSKHKTAGYVCYLECCIQPALGIFCWLAGHNVHTHNEAMDLAQSPET